MIYPPLFSPTVSSLIDFLTIHDGGNDFGLSDLPDVIMQEVAVEYSHVGNLIDLDRTQRCS